MIGIDMSRTGARLRVPASLTAHAGSDPRGRAGANANTSRVVVIAAALLFSIGADSARADVVDASPAGFSVRTVVQIAAPAVAVYDALTGSVGRWWDGSHSWSGNPANLTIVAQPGGCFCEALSGGGAQHMTVLFADRGKTLRMSGGLGPLQSMAVVGVWTISLREAEGRTTLEAVYAVSGYTKDGLAMLAAPVDAVTSQQVARLKAFVER